MATQDAFERTLALLYEAALTDGKWVPAAASINDLIRTNGHSLSYVNLGLPDPEIFLSRFFVGRERRDDFEELYFRDYYWRDEALPRLHGLGDGEVAYRSDLLRIGKRRHPSYTTNSGVPTEHRMVST